MPRGRMILLAFTIAAAMWSSAALAFQQPLTPDEVKEFYREPTKIQKIDSSIRRTRSNPNYTFFVVGLPADRTDAREMYELWKSRDLIHERNLTVYFLQGDDANIMQKRTGHQDALPFAIAFRNGQAHHARTGRMAPDVLDRFLNTALEKSSSRTYSAVEVRRIYDQLIESIDAGTHVQAAELARTILFITEGELKNQKLRTSFSQRELSELTDLYALTLEQCQRLDLNEPFVHKILTDTRSTAYTIWEHHGGPEGISLWIDLSLLLGQTDEVVAWIQLAEDNKEVRKLSRTYASRLIAPLIEHERWSILADVLYDPRDVSRYISWELEGVDKARRQGVDAAILHDQQKQIAYRAALCHAILLRSDRDDDAWWVSEMIDSHFPVTISNAALCAAAFELGEVRPMHHALLIQLDRDQFSQLHKVYSSQGAHVRAAE